MLEYKTYIDQKGQNYLKEVRKIEWKENLNSPQNITRFMKENYHMDQLAEEYLYIIAVNQNKKSIGIFEVSHGTNQEMSISNREIFIRLCLCGATGFIMLHNHPSGSTVPSESDMKSTAKVRDAAELMGIEFIDHIVIGDEYYSFREMGMM